MKKFAKYYTIFLALLMAAALYTSLFHSKFAGPFANSLDNETYLAGKKLFLVHNCQVCHGKGGSQPVEGYPHVNGQPFEYILTQLRDIKSGRRQNGQSNFMQPTVSNVQESDLEKIAYYLSNTN